MAETESEPLLADKSIAFPIMCDPTAVIHPVSEQKRKKNKTKLFLLPDFLKVPNCLSFYKELETSTIFDSFQITNIHPS